MAVSDSRNRALESWEQFLNPQELRYGLIGASLYLTAWETLKAAVIDRVRDFYWCGFDENGDKTSPEYETRVLARSKSKLKASLLWFQEAGAIDEADIQRVERVRELRNDIAHHLPEFITGQREVQAERLIHLCEFVGKIERWWLRNVELPINPDFDDQDISAIPDSEMMSGRMIFLRLLFEIATGDEEESMKYYKGFIQAKQAECRPK
jgi:hypothetical protein